MTDDVEAPEVDPSAGWSDRRRRHEAEMAAATKRALELLATTRHCSAGPGVDVQGRWFGFPVPRVRGPAWAQT